MVHAHMALVASSLQYLALAFVILGISWTLVTLLGSCVRTVQKIQYGVSIAAEGASYVGMGAAVLHMAKVAIGMAPIASAIHSFFASASPIDVLNICFGYVAL